MVHARSAGSLVAGVLLLAASVSSATVLKSDTACQKASGTGKCSRHRLKCKRGRVFVVEALRGVKPRSSACGVTSPSCQFEFDSCCSYQDGDCVEAYSASDFEKLYQECWNKEDCTYSVPEHRSRSCGAAFRNVSAYSDIHYVCLTGSSISAFQWRTPVRGTGVAVEYSLAEHKDQSFTCRVDSLDCSSVSASLLLYQAPNSRCPGVLRFSSLLLDGARHFNCSETSVFSSIPDISTPFSVSMETVGPSPVRSAWAVVYGGDAGALSLTCGYSGSNLDATACSSPDCYTVDGDGLARYWGGKNTTVSGRTCQRWDQQTPHSQERWRRLLQVGAPDLASQENFCRDTDKEGAPWCYTTDPDVRWEFCNVTSCSDVQTKIHHETTVPSVSTREGTPTGSAPEVASVSSSNSSEQPADDPGRRRIVVGVVAVVLVLAAVGTSVIVVYICFKRRRSLRGRDRGMMAISNASYCLHVPSATFSSTFNNPLYGSPDCPDGRLGPDYVSVPNDIGFAQEMTPEGFDDVSYNHLGQGRRPVFSPGHLSEANDVEYSNDHTIEGDPSFDVICNVYDVSQPAASDDSESDVYINYNVTGLVEREGTTNT